MIYHQIQSFIKVLIVFTGFGTNGNHHEGGIENFELNPDYLVTLDQEDPKLINGMYYHGQKLFDNCTPE